MTEGVTVSPPDDDTEPDSETKTHTDPAESETTSDSSPSDELASSIDAKEQSHDRTSREDTRKRLTKARDDTDNASDAAGKWETGDVNDVARGDFDGDGDSVTSAAKERKAFLQGVLVGMAAVPPSKKLSRKLWVMLGYTGDHNETALSLLRYHENETENALFGVGVGMALVYIPLILIAGSMALGFVNSGDPFHFLEHLFENHLPLILGN